MTKMSLHHQGLARVASFLMAITLSTVILIYPQAFINDDGRSDHSFLMLLLVGISIGFIHGIGFSPKSLFWREFLGPIVSWPIMVFGLYSTLSV